eukprot:scaffold63425_cov15-Tisochrysis_lutea.AAC.1
MPTFCIFEKVKVNLLGTHCQRAVTNVWDSLRLHFKNIQAWVLLDQSLSTQRGQIQSLIRQCPIAGAYSRYAGSVPGKCFGVGGNQFEKACQMPCLADTLQIHI